MIALYKREHGLAQKAFIHNSKPYIPFYLVRMFDTVDEVKMYLEGRVALQKEQGLEPENINISVILKETNGKYTYSVMYIEEENPFYEGKGMLHFFAPEIILIPLEGDNDVSSVSQGN